MQSESLLVFKGSKRAGQASLKKWPGRLKYLLCDVALALLSRVKGYGVAVENRAVCAWGGVGFP